VEENSFSVHPARLKVILRGIGDDERTTINNIFGKNLTTKCGPALARKTKADRDFRKIRKRVFRRILREPQNFTANERAVSFVSAEARARGTDTNACVAIIINNTTSLFKSVVKSCKTVLRRGQSKSTIS